MNKISNTNQIIITQILWFVVFYFIGSLFYWLWIDKWNAIVLLVFYISVIISFLVLISTNETEEDTVNVWTVRKIAIFSIVSLILWELLMKLM